MPRKPKAVPLSKVDDIQASLKQKAATPKTISLEELVKSLAKPIQDMLDAGYAYEDVAEVFNGHGVELTASGIKSFHKKSLASAAHHNKSDSADTSDSSVSVHGGSPIESDGLSADSTVELSDEPKPSTRVKKAAAKEQEKKSSPTSQPNRLTFEPKIYSDDEL